MDRRIQAGLVESDEISAHMFYMTASTFEETDNSSEVVSSCY